MSESAGDAVTRAVELGLSRDPTSCGIHQQPLKARIPFPDQFARQVLMLLLSTCICSINNLEKLRTAPFIGKYSLARFQSQLRNVSRCVMRARNSSNNMCFANLLVCVPCKVKCVNMPLRLLKQDLMEIVTDSGPTIKSILGSMEKCGWKSNLVDVFHGEYVQGRFFNPKIFIGE